MSDFDRDAVIRRIAALMEKTVAAGCTEQEAMSAAAAAQNLMNKYQMSLSDIKIREEICEQLDIATTTKDGGPMFYLINAIGYFTDTKQWRSRGAGPFGSAMFRFFGFKTDVAVAGYIYDICQRSMIYGWEDYRRSVDGYTQLPGPSKDRMKTGFYMGMANRLDKRLREMKDAQRAQNLSNGRDLVLVKMPKVEEEFAKLGIKFGKPKDARSVKLDYRAWEAGDKAGREVGLNPGVGQSSRKTLA
jgi:hypothetical protein